MSIGSKGKRPGAGGLTLNVGKFIKQVEVVSPEAADVLKKGWNDFTACYGKEGKIYAPIDNELKEGIAKIGEEAEHDSTESAR